MRSFVLVLSFVSLALASASIAGCEQSDHDPSLSRALERLATSVDQREWSTVWELTDEATQGELLKLHGELHGALGSLESVVERADLPAARRALGAALINKLDPQAPEVGPELLARLFDASAVTLDEHALDGLEIQSVQETDGVATVTTIVGEVFTFKRTEAGWRSLLVRDLLERSKLSSTYRQRAVAVTEREQAHRAAWSASEDPKTAHGAYNLARAALSEEPVNARALFAFLDEPARDALVKALERSRVVQRALQKRHKGAARVAVYKSKKMWHHVRAASDRQLYMYWAEQPGFEAPFATRAPPERVEVDDQTGRATVHTADGARVVFAQDSGGYWKLADQQERLLKLLWEPMDRAYERLARPPEFWKYKDDP